MLQCRCNGNMQTLSQLGFVCRDELASGDNQIILKQSGVTQAFSTSSTFSTSTLGSHLSFLTHPHMVRCEQHEAANFLCVCVRSIPGYSENILVSRGANVSSRSENVSPPNKRPTASHHGTVRLRSQSNSGWKILSGLNRFTIL